MDQKAPIMAIAPTLLMQLGKIVTVKLQTQEEFTGEMYCFDPVAMQFCILKKDLENGNANFYMIRSDLIKEVTISSTKEPNLSAPLSECTPVMLDKSVQDAKITAEQRRSSVGVRVTKEAQDLFNFIHKTHPGCYWEDGDCIKVLNVLVPPPYQPEHCKGSGPALERIKLVVKWFRQRQNQNRYKTEAAQSFAKPKTQRSLSNNKIAEQETTKLMPLQQPYPLNVPPFSTANMPVYLVDQYGNKLPANAANPSHYETMLGVMMMFVPDGGQQMNEDCVTSLSPGNRTIQLKRSSQASIPSVAMPMPLEMAPHDVGQHDIARSQTATQHRNHMAVPVHYQVPGQMNDTNVSDIYVMPHVVEEGQTTTGKSQYQNSFSNNCANIQQPRYSTSTNVGGGIQQPEVQNNNNQSYNSYYKHRPNQ